MILSAEKLVKTFKLHTAVDQVNITMKEKECVALLGPNGSGKTTTLKMLSGLLTPDSGRIIFLGKTNINRQHIGYLPQYPSFFPWMTAEQYLHFSGNLSGVPKKILRERVEEMLAFAGLEDAKKKQIGGFSGGMKQRLGLAQALLHKPKLLILDEPVSALDPTGRRDVLMMMNELKTKMSILFSTHVLHDAEQICDDIVVLKDGKVKWAGPLSSLKRDHLGSSFILETEEDLKGWLGTRKYVKDVFFPTPKTAQFMLEKPNDRNRLLTECMENGLTITRFSILEQTLEDAYMELIQE
ncbi:ABC-2 type transport system ATP-binding protein [Bacillus thermophilus]|uniref:ABC-2 type transport system ATP-binding protein n=1 Tax=Siminovitchia thermophila TaxID=1245522 RepID=A0ABS2R9J8_9BACI|nr:ABC-2 type transport system ATP-binding protein [Siminovitchia thermophila]